MIFIPSIGGLGVVRRMLLPAAGALALGCPFAAAAPPAACAPREAITATVRSAVDGRSVLLEDGREVRLSAIEVPLAQASAATAALISLVGAREVTLSPLEPAADRYGRLNMHAFISTGASAATLLETALVTQGLALASLRGDAACVAALKVAEAAARRAKAGFWNPDRAMTADRPASLQAGRGGFAVVTGKVGSVRESGGTIYLNFGRRWSEDFTATVLRRNEPRFRAAGVVLRQLEGRIVRIRGVIEERGGPWIEIVRPEQIEVATGSQ